MKGRYILGQQGVALSAHPSPEPGNEPPAIPADSGALYREHAPRVTRWVARLAGPLLDVEELVQEVFIKAHLLLPTFRGEAAITTWLYRIAENTVKSRRRKERVRRWLRFRHLEDVDHEVRYPTPLEELERREAQQKVYRALDGVSDAYRTVFILFELEGLSGEEIARLTDTRLSTVWVRLHRAREQFFRRARKLDLRDALSERQGDGR
jgi:RNA polymerase sigma-70 factor (ECF subfamily)